MINLYVAFNSLRIRLGGSLQDQVTYEVGKHYDGGCPGFRRHDGRLFGFTDGCLSMNLAGTSSTSSSAEPGN